MCDLGRRMALDSDKEKGAVRCCRRPIIFKVGEIGMVQQRVGEAEMPFCWVAARQHLLTVMRLGMGFLDMVIATMVPCLRKVTHTLEFAGPRRWDET
jgi:hypothetical protein